jgi:tRNA(Ile)-lysidine synthase
MLELKAKALKTVKYTLQKYKIKDNVLIGFSGGQDSLALTLIVNEILNDMGVIIVNHNILKNNPTKKIKKMAERIGIKKIFIENVNVKNNSNMEKNARIARYKAFEKVIKKNSAQCILLAHTKDDQAETVLLNLIRGSGLNALKGMPEKRDKFIRPFMSISRDETLKICQNYGIKPWNDPSNKLLKNAPLRVKIREKIIPEIEKVSKRNIKENLYRTAKDMTNINEFIEKIVEKEKTVQISKLKKLDKVIRIQILRNILLENGANPSKTLKKHLNEVDKLVTDFNGQKEIQIPGNIRVKRSNAGKIEITNEKK